MSTSDGVVVYRGKVIKIATVTNQYGLRSCSQCIGQISNELCDELPDTCRTHEVHFEECE